MPSWCEHLGRKIFDGVFRGETDTYLSFCAECGEPIIENALDVSAYISKPRTVVNGKVVTKRLTVLGKIDFILEHARLLQLGFMPKRGRPPRFPLKRGRPPRALDDDSLEFEDDGFFWPREWEDLPKLGDVEDWSGDEDERVIPFEQLTESFGSGRMPGRTYVRFIYWCKRFYRNFLPMIDSLYSIVNSLRKSCEKEEALINARVSEVMPEGSLEFIIGNFLVIMAKAGLKLTKSQIKAVYAAALVRKGFKYAEASRICHIKYETIKTWESYLKAALKKAQQFKKLTTWPEPIGVRIVVKGGRVVKVEPSIIKGDKVPDWIKLKDGKLIIEE